MPRILLIAALLLGTTPATLLACLCEFRGDAIPRVRAWSQMPRIFIGNAIEVDDWRPEGRYRVKFLTEASWTGAVPDTLTLIVGQDASCAEFMANGRYMIFADTIPGSTVLWLPPCGEGWSLTSAETHRRRAALGEPTWIAPPMGQRAIDAGAVQLGTPVGRGAPADTLLLTGPTFALDQPGRPTRNRPGQVAGIIAFEIGDWIAPGSLSRLWLGAGLYQYPVTFTDGVKYEGYLSVRCEKPTWTTDPCHIFRWFGGLREELRISSALPATPPRAESAFSSKTRHPSRCALMPQQMLVAWEYPTVRL